ncbi:hypothetical protein C4900_11555 [Acidiferrobacter thiooxydans]|uniref:Uncharacterized protein n=1 Tax=Acidiferrobacter thiooxydans TaxID=163359 RepID=A0A368HGQ4_9GAMM|nr:hypothetical protein C4900_11555 [Acidiferrobacter thiooxydans]
MECVAHDFLERPEVLGEHGIARGDRHHAREALGILVQDAVHGALLPLDYNDHKRQHQDEMYERNGGDDLETKGLVVA